MNFRHSCHLHLMTERPQSVFLGLCWTGLSRVHERVQAQVVALVERIALSIDVQWRRAVCGYGCTAGRLKGLVVRKRVHMRGEGGQSYSKICRINVVVRWSY